MGGEDARTLLRERFGHEDFLDGQAAVVVVPRIGGPWSLCVPPPGGPGHRDELKRSLVSVQRVLPGFWEPVTLPR